MSLGVAELEHLRELVAQSDVALARLDHYRHLGDAGLERAALRKLREEHETIKALLGELAVEDEDTEAAE